MELVIDGRYLSLHTAWGDLDWSLCWPGYSDEATFDVARQPSWFKPGLLGFLVWGGVKMFAGTLEEPTRGSQMRLTGLHRLGENYAALDGLGAMSLAPNEALTTAIARGLPWTKPDLWPDIAVPLGMDSPATLTQVIDADTALIPGHDWGVLPDSSIRRFARPAVRLHVRPGGDGLGIAWDNYASTLIARYYDGAAYQSATRTDSTAEDRWGAKEAVVPKALNDGATMTLAQAQAILDSMLAKGRAKPGWTTPIEVAYGALTDARQCPVDLRSVKPYEQVRVHGITEDIGGLPGQTYVDMPLARYAPAADGKTAVLTPEGLVSPLTDVLSGK